MCDCKVDLLIQKRINHFQSRKLFGCDCQVDHQYFAAVCSNCPHNANSFA